MKISQVLLVYCLLQSVNHCPKNAFISISCHLSCEQFHVVRTQNLCCTCGFKLYEFCAITITWPCKLDHWWSLLLWTISSTTAI